MLEALFDQINRIYDLELEVNIDEFLIGKETARHLAGEAETSAVVVKQGQDLEEVQLGIYVGEETLSRLRRMELSDIGADGFASVLTAIEEVSHFAYLFWNAGFGKQVTQLELELQGEVDKFVTSAVLLARQNHGKIHLGLVGQLFGAFALREGIDDSRRERYRAASSFARSYCASLVRRYLRAARLPDLLAELRRFYRLSQLGKIDHIYRAVYDS